MDWKYWHQIKKKIDYNALNQEPFSENSEYMHLSLTNHIILHKLMTHFRPKNIGCIGGFTNLDFFISQKGIDSIRECTNIDGTPAGAWVKRRQIQFQKDYNYNGRYKFINQDYPDADFDHEIDLLWAPIQLMPMINSNSIKNVDTMVLHYALPPSHLDFHCHDYHGLPRRLVSDCLVIYTKKNCADLFESMKELLILKNSPFHYKKNHTGHQFPITKSTNLNDVTEIFIGEEKKCFWADRLKEVSKR